jgi:DNA end-binding protein Ku
MPRPIWTGTISFGLVSIPVKLYNAINKKSVSFNQIDQRTGSRIKLRRVSAADGTEVPEGEIVKGYELSKDRYVVVEPSELDGLDPVATRTIDLADFVDLADIDPIYYDIPYYLVPDKGGAKPYKLLTSAMSAREKVAIGNFVMRTKQYLAAIRPADGKLVISTMVYADEVVDSSSLAELDEVDKVNVSDKELAMAEQLVESLSGKFEPDKYHDEYREKVLDLIHRKAEGEEPVVAAAPPETSSKVVDLLAALEASVREAKAARSRHPTSQADEVAERRPAAKRAKAKHDEDNDEDVVVEVPAKAKRAPAARKRKSA